MTFKNVVSWRTSMTDPWNIEAKFIFKYDAIEWVKSQIKSIGNDALRYKIETDKDVTYF